jgi:hypothetical protein
MAAAQGVNTFLKLNEAKTLPATVAIDATDGIVFDAVGPDHRTLVILENHTTTEKTAKIQIGNGLQGVGGVLEVVLDNKEIKTIVLESMKYVNMSGANRGKLIIKGTDANVKAACLILP